MRYVVAVSLAALCASCIAANPDPPAQVVAARMPELRVSLDTDTVKSGEDVVAHVTLDNHGAEPHRLDFGTGCHFDWKLTARDGTTFTTRCVMCTMAPSKILLSTGLYEASIVVQTKRTCDVPWPFTSDRLPPGWYRLTVLVIGYENQFETHPASFEVIE